MNKYVIYLIIGIILFFVMKKLIPFKNYFVKVFGNEILASDPDKIIVDSGGITKYGISDLADKIEDGKYFGKDIKTLTKDQALEIYKKNYFNPYAINFQAYPNFCLNVFDVSVNSGVGRSKKMVAKIFGTYNTNDVLGKLATMGDKKASELLKVERRKFYHYLADKNPTKYGKYLKGWLNRVDKTNM